MPPQAHNPSEVEEDLHEHTLHEFLEDHPHFIPSLARSVEDIVWINICRYQVLSGGTERDKRIAMWINNQPGLINAQTDRNWLDNQLASLDYIETIGTPNTDNEGNPIPITETMQFDSVSLHADEEAVADLHQRVAHNHQALVKKGRAHYDPETHQYWTPHGISSPEGYHDNGDPYDEYYFEHHEQWGEDLYGEDGHPEEEIAGGHTSKGAAALSLLGGLTKKGVKMALK